jgi:hypothetical protein
VIRILLAGFGAGALIAILAVLVEHSRIAFGSYALYGNGALIIPALLAPWALYWGWTWVLSRAGGALEMALVVAGVHLGVGLVTPLDVIFFPQQASTSLVDALPGFLLTGSIFVTPPALLAAIAYWLFTRRVSINAWSVFAAGFVAAVLVVVYWVGLGILTGLCVAAAQKDPARRVAIGIALLVLLIVLGNLPYFPALFSS